MEKVQTLHVNLCITAWPFGPNPKEVNKPRRKYDTEYSKFGFPIRRVAYYPLMMACVQADDTMGRNVVDALLKAGANPDITYRKIPLAKMVEQNKMPSHAWLKDRLNQAIRERQ